MRRGDVTLVGLRYGDESANGASEANGQMAPSGHTMHCELFAYVPSAHGEQDVRVIGDAGTVNRCGAVPPKQKSGMEATHIDIKVVFERVTSTDSTRVTGEEKNYIRTWNVVRGGRSKR